MAVANHSESKKFVNSGFSNFFELFNLPQKFEVNLTELDQIYLKIQQEVHPDKHTSSGEAQKRVAMQLSTYANTAFETLKDPIKRGFYLCELSGLELQLETNTTMPPEFLIQQMEWREELDEIKQDVDRLEDLFQMISNEKNNLLVEVKNLIDVLRDLPKALNQLRCALFMERFLEDVSRHIDVSLSNS